MFHLTELKAVGDLKSVDIRYEMQSLEFAELVSSFVLVQYFLTILLCGMVMYIV